MRFGWIATLALMISTGEVESQSWREALGARKMSTVSATPCSATDVRRDTVFLVGAASTLDMYVERGGGWDQIITRVGPDTLRAVLVGRLCGRVGDELVFASERGRMAIRGFHLSDGAYGAAILAYYRDPQGALSRVQPVDANGAGARFVDHRTYVTDQARRRDSLRVAEQEEQTREAAAAELAAERASRDRERGYARLGWSSRAINAVMNGQIYVGMTAAMVEAAWGQPEHRTRSVSGTGVFEQWAYSLGHYVYLNDGKVSSFTTTSSR